MNTGNLKRLRWEILLVAVSIVVGLAFAGFMISIAAQRELKPLEALLFQIIILGVSLVGGLIGSYKFGQNVAANRQYARSALRSVLVPFSGLQRLHENVKQLSDTDPSDARFGPLQSHIESQIGSCLLGD